MKFRHFFCAAILTIAPLTSFAFIPETGVYEQYTPDNSAVAGGTGVTIEIQNEYMLAAGFVFNPNGTPTFVTMQGQLVLQANGDWALDTNGTSNGVAAYNNGQCIGTAANCPYKKPNVAKVGDFSISFTSPTVATLTWGVSGSNNTVTTTLVRYNYNNGGTYGENLLGQWDLVIDHGVSGDALGYEGDRVLLQSISSDHLTLTGCSARNNGDAGCFLGLGGTQNVSVATDACSGLGCAFSTHYTATVRLPAVLVGSPSIVRVYKFSSGFVSGFSNSFKGTAYLCPEGQFTAAACTTTSANFVAYRSGSYQYAHTGTGMH